MIAAGKRDRKISFYSTTKASDGLGAGSRSRTLVEPAFAAVQFGSASERRDAGQAGSVQTATFRVLSTAALRGVDETGEIEFDSAFWGITSIAHVGTAQREIEFTATRTGA